MAEAAGLTLSGIVKSYGTTPVLHGIDLDVAPGEFLTLVGPSGCGKSTLLRILAGLEAPDGGAVSIAGRDVTQMRAADRNLAMVFQSYALYPHLTVAQNMATPLRLRDLTRWQRLPLVGNLLSRQARRRIGARVRAVAEILQIEPLLDRKPGQLSGGQRQRVALGRAMVRDPVAFLMDEPLSNLDAALRVHMRAELAALHRRLGRAFVYVTHDQAEALTLSDRMAVMRGGRLLQLGTPAQVYGDPVSLEVASFIGSPRINTLPGEIRRDGAVTCMGLPLGLRSGAAPGPATVAIRPEHLTTGEGFLSGTLNYAENLGADIYLHVHLGAEHEVVLRAPAGLATPAPGARISVARGGGLPLLFAADGARLPATPAVEAVA
ncbi:MAG: ABC transporter ATP-binding protein [Pseudomonadota bacterium]